VRPLSLKFRITLLTVVIIAIVIVVISAVTYRELKDSLERAPDPELRMVAATMRTRIGQLPSRPGPADLKGLGERRPFAATIEVLVWSRRAERVQIVHSPRTQDARVWIASLDRAKRPAFGKERLITVRQGDKAYRAAWCRYRLGDETLSTLAITSLSYAQHEMWEFLRMLVVLGVSMLLAAGILAALSVWWAMRPMRITAKRLESVTHRNLGAAQLAGIQTPVELRSFVRSVSEMLARVNEGVQSQKRFIAEASHELRTPLTLVKSTIQATRLKARTNDEYRRRLDELLADVDRLGHLVGQLLDLARLDETSREADVNVAVGPILRSLADQYEAQAAAAGGGKIICEIPDTPLTVKASPVELESLFGNLVDNAVKYGPAGGTITVRAMADAGQCVVTIHDQGGHIPASEIDLLFDRFYRLDASRSRATGGSGLGLAIARQIALRYGGDIQIASSPAEGTTISVRLPLANPA